MFEGCQTPRVGWVDNSGSCRRGCEQSQNDAAAESAAADAGGRRSAILPRLAFACLISACDVLTGTA